LVIRNYNDSWSGFKKRYFGLALSRIRDAFIFCHSHHPSFPVLLPAGGNCLLPKRANTGAIFALNLFLGWSLIGWVIALVWALKDEEIL
jgi:hypothetical protein